MPAPEATLSWGGALAWLAAVTVCAFLVAWVITDLLKIRRTPYIGVLAVVTGALTYGYVAWSGADAVGFVFDHWGWGLVGAAVAAGINVTLITLMLRRGLLHAPPGGQLHGVGRILQMLWEDV